MSATRCSRSPHPRRGLARVALFTRPLTATAALALTMTLAGAPLAADETRTGSVRDPAGRPLAGAQILVDGVQVGESDADGRFELPSGASAGRLEVRLAGYQTREVALTNDAAGGAVAIELLPAAGYAEEVVVAALRAAEGAPFAVSELDAATIEQADYGQEMPYLLARTPGITAYSETGLQAGGGYSYFSLRGLSQGRVNMTWDGVPLNDPEESAVYFANFGDFGGALDSIQIQRGVGTSSVGAASYGGAIHFTSRAAAEETRVGAELAGGGSGTGRASVEWQSGRGSAGLAGWVRASFQQTDGWRDHSGIEQRSVYFGADWRGTRTYARLGGFSGREETELAFYAVEPEILEVNPRANPMQPDETDDFGQDLVYLLVGRQVSDRLDLAAQVYYSGAQGHLELYDDPEARVGLSRYGIDGHALGLLVTARARGERWTLDAGLHGSDFEREHFGFDEAGARLYANTGFKDEAAVFAKLAVDVAPRWRLFGDLQLRRAEFRYDGAVEVEPVDWSFVNPRLGATFAATQRLTVRASVGRSGREPARNDLLEGQDDLGAPIDLEQVRPEEVVDYEVGVDWRGERFEAAVGLYAMEFEDEIAATGEQSELGYSIRRNLPESSRRGIELEAAWQPNAQWRVAAHANLARNRIARWRQAVDVYDAAGEWLGTELVTVRDVEPALSPATVVGASVEWRPRAELGLELAGRHVSRSQLDNLGLRELRTPAYEWFDLAASWDLARLAPRGAPRIWVRINNLLDADRVWPSGYSYPFVVRGGGAAALTGTPYYYPLASRHLVAGVTVTF